MNRGARQAAWRAQVQEPALLPDLPIIDPHHHLWDHAEHRYLLDELLDDIDCGHNITATVFVECAAMYRAEGPEPLKPVGETEFVQGIAAMSASGQYGPPRVAAGIVGHADLTLGDAAGEVLDAHLEASPNRFRGIRHASAWDASPDIRESHARPPEGLLGDRTFRRGFAQLAPRGLSFDAWLFHRQIPELTDLARAFPDTRIILDHVGGPLGIGPYEHDREAVLHDWTHGIAELAACDNVVVKLGGLTMAICGFGWHRRELPPTSEELAEANGPWYHRVIEHFGVERCMYESNFPVDGLSCGYGVLWNSFKRMSSGCSDAELAALFHDTAARVYRL